MAGLPRVGQAQGNVAAPRRSEMKPREVVKMRIGGASGLTLVELMVTLAIAVILLAVAVPSFQDFILNARRTALANELVLALTYAKSEAVKRGVTVTVCSRLDDSTCAGRTTWDGGWLIFVDLDNDGVVDAAAPPPEEVLQVRPALPAGSTCRTANLRRVTFQATGFSPGYADSFRLCDQRGVAQGRQVIISLTGRVRTGISPSSCP